jgi:hypothetical protein
MDSPAKNTGMAENVFVPFKVCAPSDNTKLAFDPTSGNEYVRLAVGVGACKMI